MNGSNKAANCSILALLGALCLSAQAIAQAPAAPVKPTLLSGDFDDFLMVAADHEAGTLSGYYNDGKCRFVFADRLSPIELYQRRDFGEAYAVRSWDPARPERTFSTTLYSRARGGYQDQITLEPGQNDPGRPAGCRRRITLDRAGNVSNSFMAVRVVRKARPKVFQIAMEGTATRLVPLRQKPLQPGTGVWATRTYSAAFSPPGYVYLNWYDPPGTPQGGYVREADLYSLPEALAPSSPAVLRVGNARFSGADIAALALDFDPAGMPVLDMALVPSAGAQLAAETGRLLGQTMDIALGERLIGQPTVVEVISGSKLRLAGGHTLQDVRQLVQDIACTLGLPNTVVSGMPSRDLRCADAGKAN